MVLGGEMSNEVTARIAEIAGAQHINIGVAESLTAGAVASALGAADSASDWFSGGVVAYATVIKQSLLHVDPGPVVSARCAAQMASGALALLGADVTVATTGAGGPEPQDGQPVGTVFIAVNSLGTSTTTEHHFDGPPSVVVAHAVTVALHRLLTVLENDAGVTVSVEARS